MNDRAVGFGIGLMVGAAMGVAAGILFAPRSGRETRAMLKAKADTIIAKAKEKAACLTSQAEEAAETD